MLRLLLLEGMGANWAVFVEGCGISRSVGKQQLYIQHGVDPVIGSRGTTLITHRLPALYPASAVAARRERGRRCCNLRLGAPSISPRAQSRIRLV